MDEDELEEQIKAQVEEWSSNSNECFTIELVQGDTSVAASFQPEFTYPIFGEEEAIFGYQDLEITLTFAAHNLKPHLAISYDKKFPAKGEVKPTDIHEALRDFLPDTAFSTQSADEALLDDNAATFNPPGERVKQYSRDGQQFEIWCASLSDPAARQLLENMQILVPMFIEGGTTLQLEQDWTTQRWKLFLLYSVQPKTNADATYSPYSLVGYGTSYRVFTFYDREDTTEPDVNVFSASSQSIYEFLPPPQTTITNDLAPTTNPGSVQSPLDLPSRERLSQFLILPPFQKEGHGPILYNTMYSTLIRPSNVFEFTVEDPNEAFDDLRDLCDLVHLRANDPEFATLRINTEIPSDQLQAEQALPVDLIVPLETRKAIMKRSKIQERQFDRLVEMHTLSFVPPFNRSRNRVTKRENSKNPNDKAYYLWRLYVKQRLYVFNRDQLAQLERSERIEKLESALDAVQQAYEEIIERVEKREEVIKSDGANGNGSPMAVEGASEAVRTPKARAKRKIVEDDEEDEEDEEMADSVAGSGANGHKKVRVG